MFSFFKKGATVDEVGSTFALYVQGRLPDLSYDEDFQYFQNFNIDKSFFEEERRYLRASAVDLGTSLELGLHNPKRNVILDAYIDHLLEMTKSGGLPANFMEKYIEHSLDYTEAIKTPSNIGPHYNVSKVFASQFSGYAMDSRFISRAEILFCSDVLVVRTLLKSIKITF